MSDPRRSDAGLTAVILLLLVALLGGCAVVDSNLLSSSEAFLEAVGPEYSAYVEADPKLSQDQKDNRQRTVRAQTWSLKQHRNLLEEQDGDE